MLRRKRWGQIVAVVSLGLAMMCVTARAQVNVSKNLDDSFTPQIAVDSAGNMYVVWEDDTASNSNILLSRSTDGGANFSAPMNLSNSSGFSSNPRIAVDSQGFINVVWQDSPDITFSTANIFFRRSTDGGANFSAPMNLSNDNFLNSIPQIAGDTAGNIYVVWEKDDILLGTSAILFSSLSKGGASFLGPQILPSISSRSIGPQIAVDNTGNIYVVWEEDIAFHSDISFTRSADKGATFPLPTNLSNPLGNAIANSNSPQIAVDLGGNINVVWANDSPGNFDIFFSRSTDGGLTFSTLNYPKNLSNSLGQSGRPQIAVDAGNINVVWQESNPSDIFFARSGDGGATFSTPPINVSADLGSSFNARIALDASGNINVAWEDTTPGNRDIFFARSVDGGVTFPPQNLSNDAGLSLDVQIAVDKNGNTNVVWASRPTPVSASQIFFSRLPAVVGVNQPPTIVTPPANQTVVVGQTATFSVTASGTAPLNYQWQKDGLDISGATLASYTTPPTTTQDNGAQFTVAVSNSVGKATSNPATLTVTSPPVCSPTLGVSLSPNVLWPPNHKLVQITASVEASDTCDSNPAVDLVSITSNEPDEGLGDGDQPNDIQAVGGGPVPFGTDVRSFMLRAERSGMGNGRLYTVTYRVRDASGHTTSVTAQVQVGGSSSNTLLKRSAKKK